MEKMERGKGVEMERSDREEDTLDLSDPKMKRKAENDDTLDSSDPKMKRKAENDDTLDSSDPKMKRKMKRKAENDDTLDSSDPKMKRKAENDDTLDSSDPKMKRKAENDDEKDMLDLDLDMTLIGGDEKEIRRIPEPMKFKPLSKKRLIIKKQTAVQHNRRSAVAPLAVAPQRRVNVGTPNWGDNPSREARLLVDISLQGFHEEMARHVPKHKYSFRWTEFIFGGALHINSFVVDGAIWCHINFKGKMKMQAPDSVFRDCGPLLFFAELKREYGQSEFSLVSCQNLGEFSRVCRPSLRGCKGCDRDPHRIVLKHGWNHAFQVGFTPEFIGGGSM